MSPARPWGGVVRMDAGRYAMIAALLGPALAESRPEQLGIDAPSGDEQRALYVAVNAGGYACYGGQTRPKRPRTRAASTRIAQHLREPNKAAGWVGYWVFPLDPCVDDDTVDRLEREMDARLGLPLRQRRR